MEKSLCVLAAVLYLGVFSHRTGALINDATTQGPTLSNLTAAATVKWTGAVTVEELSRATPTTTAGAKLFSKGKKPDSTENSEEIKNKEEDKEDDKVKTQLGKTFNT